MKCKYCGEDHKKAGMPFVNCHNPEEPLPLSLEDGYPYKHEKNEER